VASMITVQTESKSIEQSKSQAITGVIFFDLGGYQFPEKGWNDFIVVVLSWWLAALENIISGSADNEVLRFMDGNLYVVVKSLDGGLCQLECFDGGAGGNKEFSVQYCLAEVISAVLDFAKMVESVCSNNGWVTDDIRELKVAIKRVTQLSS